MCIRFSAWKVFQFGALVTIIMVLIYTHLQQTPLYLVILVNILFFIGIFSRIIPSQTMISAIPDAAHRGSFMAVNSSMQQISGGVAALFSGLIVYEQIDGKLAQFPILGYILTVTVILSIYFVRKIHLFTAEDKN